MSQSIGELLEAGPAPVPFDILRAGYAELHVCDLEASRHFYVDLLGFVVTAEDDARLYLRGWEEQQHHSLVLRRADVPSAARLGFRVRRESDLSLLADHFDQLGAPRARFVDHELLGMGAALRVEDPFGFPLEFFYAMERRESQMQQFHLHRGAPVLRMDHFNLHSPAVEDTFAFWQGLGFKCTEYISTDDPEERVVGAWLTRKPAVHDVALTLGRGPRLHHIGMWVAESSGVLRACDQLAAAGCASAIERGPGRHGVSNAFFVYLRDPDGHRIELYASDYYTGDPDHAPLRWSVADPRCRSFWGAVAPDSWYLESTSLLGPDGELVATHEATLDERRARTQVMS